MKNSFIILNNQKTSKIMSKNNCINFWKLFQKTGLVLFLGFSVFLSGVDSVSGQEESEIIDKNTFAEVLSDQRAADEDLMSIQFTNITLKEALELLAEKLNVGFSYNPDIMPNKTVNFGMSNVSAHKIIYKLLEGTNLEPVLPPSKDVIILKEKDSPNILSAQTGDLSGTVIDQRTNEVVPGANVLIRELERGASTDVDGNYIITDIPYGTYNVRVTFIGYSERTREVVIDSPSQTLDISLAGDIFGLDDLVVTGIASSTSKAISEVSVSRVDVGDLTSVRTYQDMSSLLSGKVAGVSIKNSSGNVGSGMRFDVRSGGGLTGNGQPVIYIDGVRIENEEFSGFGVSMRGGGSGTGQGISTLANINFDDVESINVLKGPAASALYGTSGSNGVVLIETKQGDNSGGVDITYRSVYGQNRQSYEYGNQDLIAFKALNNVFRTGPVYENNLSFSGGSEQLRYFTALGQRNEDGIMRGNELERKSIRANFSAYPNEKITLRLNTNYSIVNSQRPPSDNSLYGRIANIYLAQEGLSENLYGLTDSLAIENFSDKNALYNFNGSFELSYIPLENLEIRGTIGYDGSTIRQDQIFPPEYEYAYVNSGQRSIYNRINNQFTYDLNARYGYQLKENWEATSIIGFQIFDKITEQNNWSKQEFPTGLISNIGAGGTFNLGDEEFIQEKQAGIFFQQEMSYSNKIYFTLGGRNDYASTIGENAPNIFYPKASIAARLDNMTSLPSNLNFLKLRAAYGETGILPRLLDGSSLLWSAEQSGYGSAAVLNFIGNEDIEPERVRELELGLEAEFAEKVRTDLTYYRQWSQGSIIDFLEAPSTGRTASAIPRNVGSIHGWGVEASLGYTPVQTSNSYLDLLFIWNYQDNEVNDLGGAPPIVAGANVIKEGLPRSAFYVRQVNGALFDSNGEYAGVDVDTEKSYVGRSIPPHTGSLNVNYSYKNLSLNILSDWALNYSMNNSTRGYAVLFNNYPEREKLAAQLGLFSAHSNINSIQVLNPGSSEYIEVANNYARLDPNYNDNQISRADYIKIREVSLSYDFSGLVKSLDVKRFLMSISGSNLFTKTKYDGADPTVNTRGSRSLERGTEFFTLQNPSVYTITFTLGI